MVEELEIKRGNDVYKYHLDYDRLRISSYIEETVDIYTCKYEVIEFDESFQIYKPSILKIILFISVSLNLISLLIFITPLIEKLTGNRMIVVATASTFAFLVAFWAIYTFKPRPEKLLKAPVRISFFYEKKDRKAVDEFIESLKIRQREYMRYRYMRIDQRLSPDYQEKNISMLFERGFITLSEFEVLVEELDRLRLTREY